MKRRLERSASHTSGIPNHVGDLVTDFGTVYDLEADQVPSHLDLVGYVLDKEALFEAGQGFHYADTNYILAAMIIEQAGGASFYEIAQTELLNPLALEHTTPSDRRQVAGIVPGYMGDDNPFHLPAKSGKVGELVWNPAFEWTGGGFASTAPDLARWAKVLYEGKAFSTPYLEELLSIPNVDASRRYGLGVEIYETPYGTAYGHGGFMPGYRSQMIYFPAHGVAVAVMVNSSAAQPAFDYALALSEVVIASEDEAG